jgi:SAM-dependent methyltransferase
MESTMTFTHRVEAYKKYRPSYPPAFYQYLFQEVGLSEDSCVADVGAGTGMLTLPLAERVKTIYAVEPNRSMRLACMESCGHLCSFVALDGTAENTELPDQCLDFVTVAQAFHWFEPHRTLQEFARILKPDGLLILVWNSRVPGTPITRSWDAVIRVHCPAFTGFSGGCEAMEERIHDCFRDGICETRHFPNDRMVDRETFIGTTISSSYAPLPGQPGYAPLVERLSLLFDEFAIHDRLIIPTMTRSYVGRI